MTAMVTVRAGSPQRSGIVWASRSRNQRREAREDVRDVLQVRQRPQDRHPQRAGGAWADLPEEEAEEVTTGNPSPAAPRCGLCNWPLAARKEDGCVPSRCSREPKSPVDAADLALGRRLRALVARNFQLTVLRAEKPGDMVVVVLTPAGDAFGRRAADEVSLDEAFAAAEAWRAKS